MKPSELRAIVARVDAPFGHRSGDVGMGDLLTVISFRDRDIHALLDLLRECRTALDRTHGALEAEYGPPDPDDEVVPLLATLEGLEP